MSKINDDDDDDDDDEDEDDDNDDDDDHNEYLHNTMVMLYLLPFRSMFLDEDGDLAHEFYEEVVPSNGRPWMRRVTENLIEQGFVKLKYPRLHVDFPVAMYEG